MNARTRTASHVVVAVLTSVALFLALKGAAAAVPDGPVVRALEAAVEDGRIGEDYPGDLRGGMIDRFTECYGLGIGLADRGGHGELAETLTDPAIGSCAPLIEWLSEPEPRPEAAFNYHRYWHGYTVVTRPLLAAAGTTGVTLARGLGLLLALAGAVAFACSVGRATRPVVGVLAIAPLLLTTNVIVGSLNTLHGIATAGALLAPAAVLEIGRRRGLEAAVVVAAVGGAGFAFLDLLTVPPLAWMAVAWAVLLAARARNDAHAARTFRWAIAGGASWLVGYAGAWAGKWAATSLVLGPATVLADVRDTAGLRIGGEFEGGADVFGAAIGRNLAWWAGPLPKVAIAAIALAVLAVVVFRWRRVDLRTWALLASPVTILPVWYEVLRNHSQLHAWFTYRSLGMASGILLAAWWLAQQPTAATSAPTPDHRRPTEP